MKRGAWDLNRVSNVVNVSWQADSARGTSVGTSTALGAFVGVDAVDVAFRDGANGTFVDAGAASNAVFTNYVSHCFRNLKFEVFEIQRFKCGAKVLTFGDSPKYF